MTPHEFAAKWQKAQLAERASYQQHFLDLCDRLGQPHPAAIGPRATEHLRHPVRPWPRF